MRDGGVVSAEQIVVEMMREKSLDPDGDRRLRSDLLKWAYQALDALRRCGKSRRSGRAVVSDGGSSR
jgi:hypothetical protein